MNEWQYTNQFFEEGKHHFINGGSLKDNPYDYTNVEERFVQSELYRQNEWHAGFYSEYMNSIGIEKTA
jgi:hypothetical protein